MYIQLITKVSEVFRQFYNEENDKSIPYIGPINKINLFIGANNSGKSRFLRELLKEKVLVGNEQKDVYDNLLNSHDRMIQFKIDWMKSSHYNNNLISEYASMVEHVENYISNLYTSRLSKSEFFLRFENFLNEIRGNLHHYPANVYNDVRKVINDLKKVEDNANFQFFDKNNKIYIPVLRTANKFENSSDIYGKYLYDKYNIPKENIEIFTGLTLYDTILSDKNNEEDYRQNVNEFEKFLSDSFYNGQNVTITSIFKLSEPALKNIKIKIGNDIERDLYNMGDGINSIIILMYKIFTANKGSWVFIEEPELFLHPGFQRIFLETLINKNRINDKDLKIFVTTHSNHLLDISIEHSKLISIYSFERFVNNENEGFYIKNVQNNDLKILDLLGVNNSSVFMANCSIWVEGITDRKYLQKYLKLYYLSAEFQEVGGKLFQEDIHYAFFEYAGSNMAHYLFTKKEEIKQLDENIDKIKAEFLCNRIFLIADKDDSGDIKTSLFGEQEGDNFKYMITQGKEIENMISEKILKMLLPKLLKGILMDEQELEIISEVKYKDIGLGKYLKGIFKDKITDKISTKSGTLDNYYKNKLARLLTEDTSISWDDLSEEAKDITRNAYNFIKLHNEHE